MRYYLALAAALYGIRFVLRRQYGCFVIWIGIAALFHKSVLVVLPLYLLAVLPWKKWIVPVLTVIGGIGFVFQRPLLNLALTWYPTYRDTVYLSQDIGLKANASGILDVYKRQVLFCWFPACSFSAWESWDSICPVSYTHLDVYKRQESRG